MNTLWWIVAAVLAVAFAASGAMKLMRSEDQLRDAGMGWVDDFPPGAAKLIGAAEVLGAIGLIVPWATDIAPVLTPIAALLLGLIMVGALVVHLRRGEGPAAAPSAVLGLVSLALAAGRF